MAPRIPLSNMRSARVLHWLPCGVEILSVQKAGVTSLSLRVIHRVGEANIPRPSLVVNFLISS